MTAVRERLPIQVALVLPGPIDQISRQSSISATTSTPGHTIREVWVSKHGMDIDGTEYVQITVDVAQPKALAAAPRRKS